jgi:hypothetical protein
MTGAHTKDKEIYQIRKTGRQFKHEQQLEKKKKDKMLKEVIEYEPEKDEQLFQDLPSKNLE